ncbi:hypothetical protein QTP70_021661 [Hemibagrus guttatus]|uniref:Transposase n=1 Tax=Hemibagrus guttatus TaxID=175788 RepID=A0AAE0RBC1_9TELE|nr:hypothetical protein QTP70_021661 [Hemibagrus guttatus]
MASGSSSRTVRGGEQEEEEDFVDRARRYLRAWRSTGARAVGAGAGACLRRRSGGGARVGGMLAVSVLLLLLHGALADPGEEYKDKCVLPTVKHGGGSVMVWGCMSAAGTGELQFIEGTVNANMHCDILKQSTSPSLWRLGHRAVFQHDNDPKHTSKATTALLKKLRVKVMACIEHLWGILKRKVEERKVSNIHQLRDVIMEEWKRIPVATCEALVNSMPRGRTIIPTAFSTKKLPKHMTGKLQLLSSIGFELHCKDSKYNHPNFLSHR